MRYVSRMAEIHSLTEVCIKDVYKIQQRVLLVRRILDRYTNFTGWSEYHGVGIFTGWNNQRVFDFIRNDEDACICKKLSGSAETYL